MHGPHSLTNFNISQKVDDRTGVYLLYNSRDGPVKYVGMSTELETRLKVWTDDYRFFEYEYQPNIAEAYRRETGLYHYHGGKEKLDNEQHPPVPDGTDLECSVCNHPN